MNMVDPSGYVVVGENGQEVQNASQWTGAAPAENVPAGFYDDINWNVWEEAAYQDTIIDGVSFGYTVSGWDGGWERSGTGGYHGGMRTTGALMGGVGDDTVLRGAGGVQSRGSSGINYNGVSGGANVDWAIGYSGFTPSRLVGQGGSYLAYAKSGVQGVTSIAALAGGAVALAGCVVAEPCGLVGLIGGSILATYGAVGTIDTIVEFENIRHGRDHLPTLERIGHGFGGDQGREFGGVLQTVWDSIYVTKSTAGMVNVIEAGGRVDRLQVLGNVNYVDDLIRESDRHVRESRQ